LKIEYTWFSQEFFFFKFKMLTSKVLIIVSFEDLNYFTFLFKLFLKGQFGIKNVFEAKPTSILWIIEYLQSKVFKMYIAQMIKNQHIDLKNW